MATDRVRTCFESDWPCGLLNVPLISCDLRGWRFGNLTSQEFSLNLALGRLRVN